MTGVMVWMISTSHHASSGAVALIDKCVDPFVHQFAERRIDHALALDPRLAGEGGAFDVSVKWLSPAGL